MNEWDNKPMECKCDREEENQDITLRKWMIIKGMKNLPMMKL